MPGAGVPQERLSNALQAPVLFIRNDGQSQADVAYHVKGRGQDFFFTRDSIHIPFAPRDGKPGRSISLRPLWFADAVALRPGTQARTVFNFYRGRNPADWHTGVPAYETLTYHQAAAGIDLVCYGQGDTLEYDVILSPGVDPGRARFRVEGASRLKLGKSGELVITTDGGDRLVQAPPRLHQWIDGKKVPVQGRFKIVGAGPGRWAYGFAVAAYDRTQPLVIDPTLTYSTYVGGSGADLINGVTVSNVGGILSTYICGSTTSPNLTTPSITVAFNEAYVAKYDASGAKLWASYISGSKDDYAYAIAMNPSNDPVVVGQTNSPLNFPVTTNAFNQQPHGTSVDAFLAVLDKGTGAISYCSYFGGSGTDSAKAVAVDASGAMYVAGSTDSIDLPTKNALYSGKSGGTDGFLAKFSANGSFLHYATYLGGTGNDVIYAMAVDGQYNTYLAGETASTNFPTKNAIKTTRTGSLSAFLTKINPSGTALVFSTYLGGSGADSARGLALDSSKNIYLTGETTSNDFPAVNAIYPTLGGGTDAFAVKVDASGRFLWNSTYLGGATEDAGTAVAVESDGTAYYSGTTNSSNFPVVNLLTKSGAIVGSGLSGSYDAFVTKIASNGAEVFYSTYLGGTQADEARAIALESGVSNNVYVAGHTTYTATSNFPFDSVPTTAVSGKTHGFLAKITDTGTPPNNYPKLSLNQINGRSGQTVTFTLTLGNAGTSVGAVATTLVYDPNVLTTPVVTFDPRLAILNKATSYQTLSTDSLRLSTYTSSGAATNLSIPNGAIATVAFEVKYDVPLQFSGVTLSPSASTTAGQEIQMDRANGGIYVQQRCGLLGDCDCSGAVDLWEIQNAVNLYQTLTPLQSAPFCVVYDYGTSISSSDLVKIVNNYTTPPAMSPSMAEEAPTAVPGYNATQAQLLLAKAEKRADAWYVPVKLSANQGNTVSAVGTRITYDPEAYETVEAVLGPAGESAGKNLLVNTKNSGLLRLMVISLSNSTPLSDGVVAYLKLVPRPGAAGSSLSLSQTADASTPKGDAVVVNSPGLTAPIASALPHAALRLLLQ